MFEPNILTEENIKIKESQEAKKSKQGHDGLVGETQKVYERIPYEFHVFCTRSIVIKPTVSPETRSILFHNKILNQMD